MKHDYIRERELLDRFNKGKTNHQEDLQIDHAFIRFAESAPEYPASDTDLDQVKKRIWNKLPGAASHKIPLWTKLSGIAAAVALCIACIWFFTQGDKSAAVLPEAYVKDDIGPGRSGASLTLTNGKVIPLSGSKKGVIIGSDLTYDDKSAVITEPDALSSQQLTAATARGQTYQFTLPDGTRVWLNADSRLIFPRRFSGNDRKVVLTGEGYFDVVHDKERPFRVQSGGQVVEDIGTEFNINAYADEPAIKTTLVEGSAKITALKKPGNTLLNPGEQSVFQDGTLTVKKVDTDQYTDWKNGEFLFDGESIESIMRKVERWYDVRVIYKGEKPQEKFVGGVSRFDNVSKVLQMLEFTSGVRFKIEGRTIYVL